MNPLHTQTIASPQNPRVKEWAGLLDKKNRERSGRFLIEGVHLVMEALKAGAQLDAVVFDTERGWPSELTPWTKDVANLEIFAASPTVMAKCSDTDTAPPVFAIAAKPAVDPASLYRDGALVVVLDGLRDPGNVGTIIRSADAVGADAVVIGGGSVDLYNPKTVRSTMGSLFHLPVLQADLKELLSEAKQRGIRLVGTSLQADNSCFDHDWTGSTWLLLGNESNGISAELSSLTDANVWIPMRGQAESLNVAMAATVLLHEAMRQRYYA